MNRKLSQAAALAMTLMTALPATPGMARASDNLLSNASMPGLSLVPGSLKSQSPAKQDLPPFVSSAEKIDLEIKFDIGKLAREKGGPITIVYPKPLIDEYRNFKVSASLEGREVREDRTSEKYKRPIYVVRGDESSGVFTIKVQGVLLNRSVGPQDLRNTEISLGEPERTLFTHMGEVPALQNAGWHAKVKQLGLRRDVAETNYQYMARIAGFIQSSYNSGYPNIKDYGQDQSKMFDTKTVLCGEGARMGWALARNAGIPSRIVSGLSFHPDGASFPHSILEFFDKARGWVEIDTAVLVGAGKNKGLFENFGKTKNAARRSGKAVFIPVFNDEGLAFEVPGLPKYSSGGLTASGVVLCSSGSSARGWQRGLYEKGLYYVNVTPIRSSSEAATWIANNISRSGSLITTPSAIETAPSALNVGRWESTHFDGGKGNMQVAPTGEVVFNVLKPGANRWSNQSFVTSNDIKNGETYTVTFMVKADKPRTITVQAMESQEPYGRIGLKETVLPVTQQFTKHTVTYTAKNASGKTVRPILFELGGKFNTSAVTIKDLTIKPASDDGVISARPL